MTTDVSMLVYAAILYFVMLLLPGTIRVKGWTPAGAKLLFGNRDDLPEPSPLAARADRAAKNMTEALLMFAPLVLAARLVGVPSSATALGAQLFLGARVAYLLVYLAGVPYLRTAVWAVGVLGTGMIAAALLTGS
jgi:uncharacterized MAPEG superfamily protein